MGNQEFLSPNNPPVVPALGWALNFGTYVVSRENLSIPVYLAGVSAVILAGHLALRSPLFKRVQDRVRADAPQDAPYPITKRVQASRIVNYLALLKLFLCLVLLGTSIYAVENIRPHVEGTSASSETAQALLYLYASLLGLLALQAHADVARLASSHLTILLLVSFSVFVYRNVVPLGTFNTKPADAEDGWITWLRLVLLALGGVVIPVCSPRVYVPLDPSNPGLPAPEQTASLLSFLTFSFMDPVIIDAYRKPGFSADDLPEIPDYEHVSHLAAQAFPHLDPSAKAGKSRHIFFGIMWVYKRTYVGMVIALLFKSCTALLGPYAIKRLLAYLESGGEGATIKPWVWILALLVGPTLGTILTEFNLSLVARMTVRLQNVVTLLVFERALKMRFAEDSQSDMTTSVQVAPSVADNDSTDAEGNSQLEGTSSSEVTLQDRPADHTEGAGKGSVTASTTSDASPKVSGKEDTKTKESTAEAKNLVGRLTNLVSTDLNNLTQAQNFIFPLALVPVQLGLSIWFLYSVLGWSAFVGLATMILGFPIPGQKLPELHGLRITEYMEKTDARVQTVTETINVVRMIKLFGWEDKVMSQISEKRDTELRVLRKKRLWDYANMNVSEILPMLVSIVTFASYTLLMKQELNASKIFSSIAVFDLITYQMHSVTWAVPRVIACKVSLDRINVFLNETELLDRFTRVDMTTPEDILPHTADPNTIGFRNAVFTWRAESGIAGDTAVATPSQRNFQLRIEGDLLFKPGKINLIVGPTGAGKTSLLMALLGEMHCKRDQVDSFLSLPRQGGVAFCAQEAWIQNATVKENILFGAPLDEDRYKKVIYQCALEQDLSLFEAGDSTEVGEKGLTLSGGQKARVALARAMYSSASILLLDDILSALDVHTSRWIVGKCLRGDLMRGRTVLLVTHNIGITASLADFVVSVGSNGRIKSQHTVAEALEKDAQLRAEVEQEHQAEETLEHVVDSDDKSALKDNKSAGQLVVKEEVAQGRIVWDAFTFYFGAFGSPIFWIIYFGFMMLDQVAFNFQVWFLGYWARQYEDHPALGVDARFYLTGYMAISLASLLLMTIGLLVYLIGSLRASKLAHERLTSSVLHAPLRWLDSTPSGRIIARFTQDINAADNVVSGIFSGLVSNTIGLLFKFAAVLLYSPIFAVPGMLVATCGALIGRVYMAAQLPVKRDMSNARSPIYSHFNASMAGLISIRAYGAEDAFKEESRARIDRYTRPARALYDQNRWVSVRIETLGAFFGASLATYLVYGKKQNASIVGFSLAMALSFTERLLWWVRMLNMFEVEGNSLERIKGYVEIDQESRPTESGTPPAYWPASGSIRVESLSAKYSIDGPEVLRKLSFEVKSGERVGVVGRTGAGKSSLSLAFLRMIPTTGKVLIDGVDTSSINLDALRSNITIIPQQPELMSGTLRKNLDPFGEHDDATLNSSLHSSGLFSLQEDEKENKIGLDTSVSSGGANFSVGQRQIIAMARAMVRRSKVYILDEATASVDYKTDIAIQEAIAKEFNDSTLIIIAHRLQTIMAADKILVLDAGEVVEFDSPAALLANGGAFKALVDGSGDHEALYRLVKGAEATSSTTLSRLLAI
ncbi:hypothetical protein FRB97_008251 [Tulasnella sp. 331]|nr:hypothetical protein FRB97_008251 [Tulasnella sp. 331]